MENCSPDTTGVITRERYRKAVEDCVLSLKSALMSCELELKAEDLRLASRAQGRIVGKISNGNSNHWMKPITEWKDIIAFSAQKTWHDGYRYDSAIIIGLKSDGTYEKLSAKLCKK